MLRYKRVYLMHEIVAARPCVGNMPVRTIAQVIEPGFLRLPSLQPIRKARVVIYMG